MEVAATSQLSPPVQLSPPFPEPGTNGHRQPSAEAYADSLAAERRIYETCIEVHRLPPIFHYWSERHLRQKFLPHGFDSVTGFFQRYLEHQCRTGPSNRKQFLSLGSGNCDLELDLARQLVAAGCRDFIIECLDLNPSMLERGRQSASQSGLTAHMRFTTGDLNEWNATRTYHAVMANQSLHHIVNLEGVFAEVKESLLAGGSFIISDMIGRNGHQRWPEAMPLVQEFWRRLPPSYRFNTRFGSYEEMLQDWDCSVEGFEGVRSQDILPLLLDTFSFEIFIPFGNLIDPFIDRSFGLHFDPSLERDRRFIDEVHARDEAEIAAGRITPTHMLAVAGAGDRPGSSESVNDRVRFFVRNPEALAPAPAQPADPYEWRSWDGDLRKDLAVTAASLAGALRDAEAHAAHRIRLERELLERTEWALRLDDELSDLQKRTAGLNEELVARTEWVFSLQREHQNQIDAYKRVLEAYQREFHAHQGELQEHRDRIRRLEQEFEERTAWALTMAAEMEARTRWALQVRKEQDEADRYIRLLQDELAQRTAELANVSGDLRRYLHNPLQYAARLMRSAALRLWRLAGLQA